jgi:DNA-binding GntR family transcriptional regulator
VSPPVSFLCLIFLGNWEDSSSSKGFLYAKIRVAVGAFAIKDRPERMKSNSVFKRAHNRFLSKLANEEPGTQIRSEVELARDLEVSRTTVRAVLSSFTSTGIIYPDGALRRLARQPMASDYFPETQTESVGDAVERRFMEWILQGDLRPGKLINCAELARQFSTSTTAIREHLAHFNHFGLLERRPNSAWVFKGITDDFAMEIYEIRELFELRSAHRFAELAPDAAAWAELDSIEREHHRLLANIDERYKEFSRLDERLHRLVHDASNNRFVVNFYDVISMIFHYHYQWNKADEKERNYVALHEHLDYIAALRSRNLHEIDAKCRTHLQTARKTLLQSIDILRLHPD